jgi:hypothetical protein
MSMPLSAPKYNLELYIKYSCSGTVTCAVKKELAPSKKKEQKQKSLICGLLRNERAQFMCLRILVVVHPLAD